MASNPREPSESEERESLETQLSRLKPAPVSMSAADILQKSEERDLSPALSNRTAPQPNWGLLAATGLAGIVVGVLLASTVFMSLQSDQPTLQADRNEAAEAPITRVVETDPTTDSENEPIVVVEQSAPIDSRISARLNDFENALSNGPPLSASSIVRPRFASFAKPADEIAFHLNQPSPSPRKANPADKPTIGSADSATLLLELLDS